MLNNTKKISMIGINGSPHKGHTLELLKLTIKEAGRRGAKTEIINVYDYKISSHSGELDPKNYRDGLNDDMVKLQEKILIADGIVFSSPTHWFNMSGQMKNFIDRLTAAEDFGFLLEGKVAGVIAYGPQGGAFNNALLIAGTLNQMGMVIPPYGFIFDEGRNDDWVEKDCKLLAKNILEQIKIGTKSKWGYDEDKYDRSPIEIIAKDEENKNKKIR